MIKYTTMPMIPIPTPIARIDVTSPIIEKISVQVQAHCRPFHSPKAKTKESIPAMIVPNAASESISPVGPCPAKIPSQERDTAARTRDRTPNPRLTIPPMITSVVRMPTPVGRGPIPILIYVAARLCERGLMWIYERASWSRSLCS